jgi:hypothetical protein
MLQLLLRISLEGSRLQEPLYMNHNVLGAEKVDYLVSNSRIVS